MPNVHSIGNYAFNGCISLKSVTIPDSVTQMGAYVFSGCTTLKYATISLKDTAIGNYAFEDCKQLEKLTINDGVTGVEDCAFSGCKALTSVTLPDSVTSIGIGAFSGCSKLTSITVPFVGMTKDGMDYTHFGYIFGAYNADGNASAVPVSLKKVVVKSAEIIYDGAFKGCGKITEIVLPSDLEEISDYYVFHNCSSLEKIEIPDGTKSIGYGAFYDCSNLKSVIIPDSVTSIGNDAFYGCNRLTSITLPFAGEVKDGTSNTHFGYIFGARNAYENAEYVPSSLKTIEITSANFIAAEAFSNCSSLTSITIPNSVTSIGSEAFNGCSGLTKVNYTGSVDQWVQIKFSRRSYTDLFSKLESDLATVIYSNPICYAKNLYINGELLTKVNIITATKINDCAFSVCDSIESVTIGNSVTSIDWCAFHNCSNLTSVTIGNNITSFVGFGGCSSLTSITVDAKNQNYKSIDGNLYSKDGKTLIKYAIGKTATSFVVPDSVTAIDDSAFSGCSGLTSITIPNDVTSIGEGAFDNCSSLTSVYYQGTESEWNKISISSGNYHLTLATHYYYSESNPTTTGKYWHYDGSGNIVVW